MSLIRCSPPWCVLVGSALWICSLSSQAENLTQALDLAVTADLKMSASQRQVDAAASTAQAARALALPQVSVEALYTRLSDQPAMNLDLSKFGLPATVLPLADQEFGAYRVGATLPIYTGGRISHSIDAADQGLAAARQDALRLTQDVRLNAAQTYANVLRASRLLTVAQTNVQTLETHERDVTNIYDQGLVALNDVLGVRVALANAQQNLVRVENTLDVVRAAYNQQMGRDLDSVVALDEVDAIDSVEPLAKATDRALEQRTELKALEHQALAWQSQADAARGAELPQVALSVGYNHLDNSYLAREGVWSAMLGLQWSLFDGGLARHQAAALEAKSAAAQDMRRDARTLIALQVRNAWLAVRESKSRIPTAQAAVALADENLRVARDRYQSGVGTNTDVIDAQTMRMLSQSNYFGAIYDNVVAVMRLRRSIGEL